MSYLYEQLNADTFQAFCQALLVKDYPDLQCFPVGQPDGGRDALSRAGDRSGEKTVAQVKFKKNEDESNADWMITALKGELPKIERLIQRGAQRYIMMTNAAGTAHEDVGRIDLVQEWLNTHVSIPSQVMWRDDLDRRLDDRPTLKLAYPSLLTGADALTLILANQYGQYNKQTELAIRAFVGEQYNEDRNVKFRQVDLTNSLLALFVDVPIGLKFPQTDTEAANRLPSQAREVIRKLMFKASAERAIGSGSATATPQQQVGTAEFLLDAGVQAHLPWIALRGAPGQGKSTLAQYVCQVHRARYLGRTEFTSKLPSEHLASPFRIPVKVDLRDLARYLNGEVFRGHAAEVNASHHTLERFIAKLIEISSGGHNFSVSDLALVSSSSPMLMFFDGLDEVADLRLREKLVDVVTSGLIRLRDGGADIQAVITSRPAQLGKSVTVGRAFYPVNLAPMTRKTILEYTEKWTLAKELPPARVAEVNELLDDKLQLSHIRELTKNPMQLTILLELILTIGHSLPNVRTDLYRKYMDLFMAREAEKDDTVRSNRLLLLSIVEYLAWELQSGAESDRTAGSVSVEELREMVDSFLIDAGHNDRSILDGLFNRGLERIYVLVQRVDGFYEFEVQPLREYFAAKYLYSTAPIGTFRHKAPQGDRAQRFEAIAQNPYWANVTRFYAGFYEDGEVPALEVSLRELMRTPNAPASVNARSIGAALLADFVFSNKKPVQRNVIELVFDELGIALAANGQLAGFTSAELEPECGRDDLALLLFNRYFSDSVDRVGRDIADLLAINGASTLGAQFVSWVSASEGKSRTERFETALYAQGLDSVGSDIMLELLYGDNPSLHERRQRRMALVKEDVLVLDSLPEVAADAVSDMRAWGGYNVTGMVTDVTLLAIVLSGERILPQNVRENLPRVLESPMADAADKIAGRLRQTMEGISPFTVRLSGFYRTPAYWDAHVASAEEYLKDSWGVRRIALLAVAYLSPKDVDAELASTGLQQALLVRKGRVQLQQWRQNITSGPRLDKQFWVAAAFAWAPSRQLATLQPELSAYLAYCDDDSMDQVLEVVTAVSRLREAGYARQRNAIDLDPYASAAFTRFAVHALGNLMLEKLPKRNALLVEDEPEVQRLRLMRELALFDGWRGLSRVARDKWFDKLALAIEHDLQIELFPKIRSLDMGVAGAEAVYKRGLYESEALAESAGFLLSATHVGRRVRDVAEGENWVFA
jgi:hypothetical protein